MTAPQPLLGAVRPATPALGRETGSASWACADPPESGEAGLGTGLDLALTGDSGHRLWHLREKLPRVKPLWISEVGGGQGFLGAGLLQCFHVPYRRCGPCWWDSILWVRSTACANSAVLGVPYVHRLHGHLCTYSEPERRVLRLTPSPRPVLPPWVPWPPLWRACSYPRAFHIGIQALASLFPAC